MDFDFGAQFSTWWPAGIVMVAGLGASHWWYRRQLAGLLTQMERVQRARQSADQMVQQARRQIEQLQKDLAAQHRARADALVQARKRAERTPEPPAQPVLENVAPRLPANGFADTQPMG